VQSNAEDALSEKELRVKIYIQYNCYFAWYVLTFKGQPGSLFRCGPWHYS
jgi:hypothetical protein